MSFLTPVVTSSVSRARDAISNTTSLAMSVLRPTSLSSKIQDTDFYKPIFGHLEPEVQKKRILQLWTAYELCRISYGQSIDEHLNALARLPYFPTPRNWQESGQHVTTCKFFLIEFDEFLCVLFRGSDSWDDWLTNIEGATNVRTWQDITKAHAGWTECVDRVPIGLIDEIAKNSKKELLLTGHSKGGAEAFLLASISSNNPICMTFAQPHVAGSRVVVPNYKVSILINRVGIGGG